MNKWRQYRQIDKGEFFLIGGDTSQGGNDYNTLQFFSRNKLDVPLVYQSHGVAADMTVDMFPVIEKIYDVTQIKPMVGIERNNGGGSEMKRLYVLNRLNKYDLFKMPIIGQEEDRETENFGYGTTGATRPILVGDLKHAIDGRSFKIYDEPTMSELHSFIISKTGKPEAEKNAHDDLVMALAIAWQMYQICLPPMTTNQLTYEMNQLPPDDHINQL